MAGSVRALIDEIIRERSGGDETLTAMTRIKMTLKGIDVDAWTAQSEDDPGALAILEAMRGEFRSSSAAKGGRR
jgi:hypothetical protein